MSISNNIVPNNNEKVLDNDDFIVSKTDIKGKITYCNQIFKVMAQYDEEELIGKPHNIIRHPDMPKIAFQVAWDLIQSGKEFFGFVKNLRHEGGFYWVFTTITPDFDSGNNIIGFTSVRRKANPDALNIIIPLYRDLVNAERTGGVSSSLKLISDLLESKKMEYNELIIALQGDY